jgi:hypothetical protein
VVEQLAVNHLVVGSIPAWGGGSYVRGLSFIKKGLYDKSLRIYAIYKRKKVLS